MIQFTTNNNEKHLVIEVPDDAYDFELKTIGVTMDRSGFLYLAYKPQRTMRKVGEELEPLEILGTFDKEKDEIDFEIESEWVQPCTESGVVGETIVKGYKNYNVEFENYSHYKDSYLSLLQLVAKDSKENKFVILKQLQK